MPNSTHQEMASLQQLLSEEGLPHTKFKSRKQVTLRNESVTLPRYIQRDRKSLDSFNHRSDKVSTQKGSSIFSSKIASSDSERTNSKSLSKGDEPAIDEVAVRAVISVLGGYIGRYLKDLSFRELIRNKCNICLARRRKDLDDGIFANLELGIKSIEKVVEEHQVTTKELRMKSLKNSVQLLRAVASLNSENLRNGSTCGVPNSHVSACAQMYLSIVYKLEKNDRVSAGHLLQVFIDSPFLARTHLLPDIWEHFFLPHLLHLKIWYQKELEILSNSIYFDKEKRMKALSKACNDQMDMGTIQFALYYREWLKVGGKAPSIPAVLLPSKPSHAPSRRISSDSYGSASSINRNLYRAVFGPVLDHRSWELDSQDRDSMDVCGLHEEFVCRADGYTNSNDITKSHCRSHRENYRIQKNESWHEMQKPSYFRFFSCQRVVSECLVTGDHIIRGNSIKKIENTDLPSSDLRRSFSTICLSESLTDCETAIRAIANAWLDSRGNPIIEEALSKAPLIQGMLDVLFASDNDEILELVMALMADFVSRNEANRLTILNSDPQLEIFTRLLKRSSLFLKAAVLLYHLKPEAKQMISIEWVTLALRVLEFGDQLQTLFTVRYMPRKAAMYFLDQLLTGFGEDKNIENANQVVSLGGLSLLVRTFEYGDLDERNNAAMLMVCCIQADGNCGNYLAENLNKNALLELIALGIQKSTGHAIALLSKLLCIRRRTQIVKILTKLNNGWGGLSTMHIFLVHLQRASSEERPLIAAILLQLDLLGDPLKSSLYREDAVEAIIQGLDCQACNSKVQEQSARALLMLGGYFSYIEETKAEEWLLQQAASHDRSLDLYCGKEIIDANLNKEDKALKDWRIKVAIILLNTGSMRFLAALSNSIANGIPNLAQSCLFTIAWMNRILLSVSDERFQRVAHSVLIPEPQIPSIYDGRVLPSISLQHLIKSSGKIYNFVTSI